MFRKIILKFKMRNNFYLLVIFVDMLHFLYLWLPMLLCVGMALLLIFLRVEQANEKLLGEK